MVLQILPVAGHPDHDHVRGGVCQLCGSLDLSQFLSDADEDSMEDEEDESYFQLSRRSLLEFEQSGRERCAICSVLKEICLFFTSNEDEDADLDGKWLRVRLSTRSGIPELVIEEGGLVKTVQLYTPSGFEPCWNVVPVLRELFSDRDSSDALGFIKSRLQSCLNSHILCRSRGSTLPTRVLDVGTSGDSRINLISTEGKPFEPYIALTYCWGKDGAIVKTTRENVRSFESGLAISDLPLVFRECIMLSRRLGTRFVWIDALCIIQDDREDWERESSKMSLTYAQAFLTIAAAMSASTSESFLSKPQRRDNNPAALQSSLFVKRMTLNGQVTELRARVIPEVGIHSKWTHWYYERQLYPRDPWSQRGWTLQEQLLSPRLLMLTSSEIQWSCQERQSCECTSPLNHRRLFGGKSLSGIENASDAFFFWHKVVEDYSIRTLSHSVDRLPAISGVAQVIQERTGSKYVAGLWSENIAEDLLWERVGEIGAQPGYLAPSYSWASVVGEIDYRCYMNGAHPYREISQVLSWTTDVQGHNQLGTVRSGEMTIRGPLTPVTLVGDGHNGFYSVRIAHRRTYYPFPADTLLATFKAPSEEEMREVVVACRRRTQLSSSAPASSNAMVTNHDDDDNAGSDYNSSHRTPIEDGARGWLLRLGFYQMRNSPSEHSNEFLVLGKSPSAADKFERCVFPFSPCLRAFMPWITFLFGDSPNPFRVDTAVATDGISRYVSDKLTSS
ncbi:hypothetical protein JX265_008707 [Neoarthrinium moseri]|uniref:Heterokaryon incompatibility domain-containing protein n=1 Tax=Neoarthrinium moseri TaxID=1658444 RepID=A0A9P9WHF1_9PEZI|nr:hypothetical protein JX266_005818 [Neoarthrinium moseri]KAI1863490.1 hypothetical protein JX265_008707 [Neoarthrinium moseri]